MKTCKICGSPVKWLFDSAWKSYPHPVPLYMCVSADCHFLHTDYLDQWSSEQVAEMYSHFWDAETGQQRANVPVEKVKLAKLLMPEAQTILDVGSGDGSGVCKLRAAGFDAYGYDLVHPKMCQEYITVGARTDVQGSYDVVTAVEVMEHLIDPIAACHWIASLVKPGGVFAFSTSTFNPHKHDQTWPYLEPLGHISLYTRPALKRLAEMSDFQVVADVFSTHIWIRAAKASPTAAMKIWLHHIYNKLMSPEAYAFLRYKVKTALKVSVKS